MKSLEPTEIVRLEKQVRIEDAQYAKIMAFVDQRRQDVSFYGSVRNGGSKEKIVDDITVGVVAEFITYQGFLEMGFEFVAPPDLTYVPRGEKVWKPDLVVVEPNYVLKSLHVKGTRGYKEIVTWTFQLGDTTGGKGKDPLLSIPETDQNNFVALIHVTGYNTGMLMCYGQWNYFKQYLRDPILKDKKGIKTCLYYTDFPGTKTLDKIPA